MELVAGVDDKVMGGVPVVPTGGVPVVPVGRIPVAKSGAEGAAVRARRNSISRCFGKVMLIIGTAARLTVGIATGKL